MTLSTLPAPVPRISITTQQTLHRNKAPHSCSLLLRDLFLAVQLLAAAGMACCSSSKADRDDLVADVGDTSQGNDLAPSIDTGPLPDSLPLDAKDLAPDADPDTTEDLSQTDTPLPPHPTPYECLIDPACTHILVAAHRGDHRNYPEGSLAAVRGAAKLGADLVELDARITADGVVVVMHDSTVDSTTDGTGEVASYTYAQFKALNLKKADPGNPETLHPASLADALALAQELGMMVYVDQKTDQWADVAQVVRDGGYEKVALIRDDAAIILAMVPDCDDLLLMPAVNNTAQFDQILAQFPEVAIVELAQTEADADFVSHAHDHGVKVQQDVMATGDSFATAGLTSGWSTFLEAHVDLWQSDLPHILIPALSEYEDSGSLPSSVVFVP